MSRNKTRSDWAVKRLSLVSVKSEHVIKICSVVNLSSQLMHIGGSSPFTKKEWVIKEWPMYNRANTVSSFQFVRGERGGGREGGGEREGTTNSTLLNPYIPRDFLIFLNLVCNITLPDAKSLYVLLQTVASSKKATAGNTQPPLLCMKEVLFRAPRQQEAKMTLS